MSLKEKTVKELKEMCKERKISGYSKLKKEDLIKILSKKKGGKYFWNNVKYYYKNEDIIEGHVQNQLKYKDNYFLALACNGNEGILDKDNKKYYDKNKNLKKFGYILKCRLSENDENLYDVFVADKSRINFKKNENCGYSYIIFEGKIITEEKDRLKENEEYFIVENKNSNNIRINSIINESRRSDDLVNSVSAHVTGIIYKTENYTIFKGIEKEDKSSQYKKIINNKKSENSKYDLKSDENYFIVFKKYNPTFNSIKSKTLNNYGSLRLMGCTLDNLEERLGVSVTGIIHYGEDYVIIKGKVNDVMTI